MNSKTSLTRVRKASVPLKTAPDPMIARRASVKPPEFPLSWRPRGDTPLTPFEVRDHFEPEEVMSRRLGWVV
jgi:hypothetical protein